MADITASMVKELRDRTGAGMMQCKAALKETDGNFDEAIVYLRTNNKEKLETREGRTAGEGVVAIAIVDDRDGAIVELNSETDFVARNDDFKRLANEIAIQVAKTKSGDVETVLSQDSLTAPGATVRDRFNDVFTKLREKLVFKRCEFISTDSKGVLASYVHVPSNDKIGVLVELESADPAATDAVKALGRELAMQIAASRPKFMTREEVPANVIAQEREIAHAQAVNEGKPAAAIEKIVEGRLRKFFEENVLLDQVYLRDPKKTVTQIIAEAGKDVTLKRFVRYEVGQQTGGAEDSGSIKEQAE